MRIIFPHIPKCAGSSIKSQLKNRSDVFFDYFNHPTWVYDPDIKTGENKQYALKEHLRQTDSWIIFGHFSAYLYFDLAYDLAIFLIRNPLERAVSHFYYIKQHLPDNEITRRRHYEVGPIKDNQMSLEEFVELDHIRYFYSKYYLNHIFPSEKFLAVAMENMEYSCKKIMEASGLNLDHAIKINRSEHNGSFNQLRDVFNVDMQLYKDLIYYSDNRH